MSFLASQGVHILKSTFFQDIQHIHKQSFNYNSLEPFFPQELLDAEFIPMPEGSTDCMSSPLAPSFSESATLPYDELQELKAAAAAAAVDNGLMVINDK